MRYFDKISTLLKLRTLPILTTIFKFYPKPMTKDKANIGFFLSIQNPVCSLQAAKTYVIGGNYDKRREIFKRGFIFAEGSGLSSGARI